MNIRDDYSDVGKRPTSNYYITRVVDHHEFIYQVFQTFGGSPVNDNTFPFPHPEFKKPRRQRKRPSQWL